MPLALVIVIAVAVIAAAGVSVPLMMIRRRRTRIHLADGLARGRLGGGPSRSGSRECPFCGLVAATFEPFGSREDARCPQCGSLERHRLTWLYLLNETDLFAAPGTTRVLHLAPEVPAWQHLTRAPQIEYVSGDNREPAAADLDLAALPFPDGSFDVVLCGHLLEGYDDLEPAADEIARILRPGGWALVQLPRTDPEARKHAEERAVALARAGFEVTVDRYPRRIGAAASKRFGLTLREEIHFARRLVAGAPVAGRPVMAGSVSRIWAEAHDVPESRGVPGAVAVFRGRVEGVRDGVVSGWVWRINAPDDRVHVRVLVDGKGVTGGIAERERRSLADAGVGDGRHAFRIGLPQSVATAGAHRLQVVPEGAIALPSATSFKTVVDRKAQNWKGAEFSVDGFIVGRVETVRGGVVCGWAWSPEAAAWRLAIRVLVNGHEVGDCRAELPRPSLARDGIGDGRHGFRFRLPHHLVRSGDYTLRVEARGAVLPAAATFGTGAEPTDQAEITIVGDGILQGRVEQIRDGIVSGWAWNPDAPAWRVRVRALVDGVEAGSTVADLHRPSLAEAGIGDGRHGFRVELAPTVALRGQHVLRIEGDGRSPLPASAAFEHSPAEAEGPSFDIEDPVLGRVERVRDGHVMGWVCKPAEPGLRIPVRVIVDGAVVADGVADIEHPELARAGFGDGRYGFSVPLPSELAQTLTHRLRVETGANISLPASSSFVSIVQRSRDQWEGVEFLVEDTVIGRIERASDGIVSGWAWRPGAAGWRVWVRVIVDDQEVCSGVADVDRPPLAEAGIGDGRHGFRFEVPALLPATGRHRVRVDAEGVALPVTVSFDQRRPSSAASRDARFVVDASARGGNRPPVVGRITSVRDGVVSGWAYSPTAPNWPVWARAVLDGEDVGGASADRRGVTGPGAGARTRDGGFEIQLPDHADGLHRLRVEAGDGVTLTPGPGVCDDGGRTYVVEVSPARYR